MGIVVIVVSKNEIRWPVQDRSHPDEHLLELRSLMDVAADGHQVAIVARARFVEDLVIEQAGHGVRQYVILGAGLDTFAQRPPTSPPRCASLRSIGRARRPGSGSV